MNNTMKLITALATIVFCAASAIAVQPAIADTSSDIPGELFSKADKPEIYCLAKNIYFEARGDNLAGRYAVADVVLNRVKDRRYPGTICEVIHQGEKTSNGNMKRHRCQFSWYCDGKADTTPNTEKWIESQSIAYQLVVHGTMRGITEGATHYHATYVDPSWNRRMDLIGRIGAHIFYRAP
jgi:spore germination cell wall hydrolase CwlJ-like protein